MAPYGWDNTDSSLLDMSKVLNLGLDVVEMKSEFEIAEARRLSWRCTRRRHLVINNNKMARCPLMTRNTMVRTPQRSRNQGAPLNKP